jgi:SAM-dependent methyltransferase
MAADARVTLRVLQTYAENEAARAEMQRRGISYWPARANPKLIDRILRRTIRVGELNKSWDVLQTVDLIESLFSREEPIVDLGAYASEVLCSLHLLGFNRLTGIDLNPAIGRMPFHESVQYLTGDMMNTPLESGSVAAVTAISAIEHGLAPGPLFAEVSRLLRPGGVFIASTDYWPDKVDTSGIRMYGLDWMIFSRQEIEALFAIAAGYGLVSAGGLQFDVAEPSIECARRHYTFAWFALTKR